MEHPADKSPFKKAIPSVKGACRDREVAGSNPVGPIFLSYAFTGLKVYKIVIYSTLYAVVWMMKMSQFQEFANKNYSTGFIFFNPRNCEFVKKQINTNSYGLAKKYEK